jgi:hypothetical protein
MAKGNRTNHPPHGQRWTKGRTERYNFALTPEDLKRFKEYAAQNNISINDALSHAICIAYGRKEQRQ